MKQLNWYQIFGKSNIPDGRTVLPTDDIQIWLHCANIWDKTYTTLAEVLADTDTLSALIASSNAVDYMVRSTTWAAGASIPTMTSNTTPSGVVLEGQSMQSGSEGYKLFDGFTNTQPYKASAATSAWIGYDFGSAVTINTMSVYSGGSGRPCTLGYSDNGVNWTDYETALTTVANTWVDQSVNIGSPHRFWRCKVVLDTAIVGFGINEVRIYSPSITNNATAMSYIGLNNYCANTLLADSTWCEAICNSKYFESVLNVKVPTMTSYTTPSGVVSQSSENSGNKGWYAFDNDLTKAWYANGRINGWLQYKFDTAKNIKCLRIAPGYGASNNRMCPRTALVMYSDDGNTFTNENTYSISEPIDASDKTWQAFPLSNGNLTKQYWRAFFAESYGSSASAIMVWELQFYGREDV